MIDYKAMYFRLFNAITYAIEKLHMEQNEIPVLNAIQILQKAQQDTEEIYISSEE